MAAGLHIDFLVNPRLIFNIIRVFLFQENLIQGFYFSVKVLPRRHFTLYKTTFHTK